MTQRNFKKIFAEGVGLLDFLYIRCGFGGGEVLLFATTGWSGVVEMAET